MVVVVLAPDTINTIDNYDSNNSGNNDDDNGFYCIIVRSWLRSPGLGCRCCCSRKYAAAAAATWDAGQ
jgi:hypothetical protein